MKRVKYLNNRDLLAQIHASKNTYCSYVNPEDAQYDVIVSSLKKINANVIALARKAKDQAIFNKREDWVDSLWDTMTELADMGAFCDESYGGDFCDEE